MWTHSLRWANPRREAEGKSEARSATAHAAELPALQAELDLSNEAEIGARNVEGTRPDSATNVN